MSEWISVEDKLPENKNIVVVITSEYVWPVTGFYIKDEGWNVSIGEFDTIGEAFFSSDSITHWMPLPEPPPRN